MVALFIDGRRRRRSPLMFRGSDIYVRHKGAPFAHHTDVRLLYPGRYSGTLVHPQQVLLQVQVCCPGNGCTKGSWPQGLPSVTSG